MKKALLIALVTIFTAGPVLADGSYRSEPHHSHNSASCEACKIGDGLLWIVKLPFRIVTSTTVGVYELVTDGDFSGFKEGYEVL